MKLENFDKFLYSDKIFRPDQIEELIKEVRPNFRFNRSNRKEKYFNVPCSLDLETSSFYDASGEKVGLMYLWIFGLYGHIVMGRTWEELTGMIDKIVSILDLNEFKRLMCFVQNLSFDFQFFRHHFNFSKVFAAERREPLYALTDSGIEFRCSYKLSGMSLEKIGENLLTYPIKKKVGDLDYKLIRHPETRIFPKEKGYGRNDGKVVMAFIAEEIERNNGISRLPLTKTGYVRKYCRNSVFLDPETGLKDKKKIRRYREIMSISTLTPEIYSKCRDGFAGGFTHANALYVDQITENVTSYDFTSSYPAVMIAEKFPMGAAVEVDPRSMTEKEFYHYLNLYECLFTIHFFGIREKPNVFENYISRHKCKFITNDCVINNGRVVSASELMITIFSTDFEIIRDFYDFDGFEISYFVYWHRAYLPTDFVKAILQLYKDKTELKGVKGKEVEYQVSKGMLNACYGMTVSRIVREINDYTDDWETPYLPDTDKAISKYNNQPGRFLFYPWGCAVTYLSRKNLFSAIKEAGEDYVYSDTDSIKLVNADKHRQYFENYNKEIILKLEAACEHHGIDKEYIRPKNIKGIEKPLGVWEYEGVYDRFKTLGAKRYIIEHDGEIELTVSGINKKLAVPYLFEKFFSPYNKYGTDTAIFNAFKDGLVIPAGYSGKSTHTYIDEPRTGIVVDYMGKPYTYNELSGIHLEETTYNMGIAGEFIAYIKSIMKGV